MKLIKYSYLVFLIPLLLLSCSNSTDSSNESPNPPTIINAENSPSHNEAGYSVTPTLQWDCIDPDSDQLIYDVYLGLTENPPLVSGSQAQSYYTPDSLIHNTTYYWKIIARDDHLNSTSSPIWRFTTKAPEHIEEFTNPETLIEISRGSQFKISLASNPATGYTWKFAEPPDTELLELIDREYIANSNRFADIGNGGRTVWLFRAINPGSVQIELGYYGPGRNETTQKVVFNISIS